MGKRKVNIDIKSPKHFILMRAFELNKILLFWDKNDYKSLEQFRWLSTRSVVSMAKRIWLFNDHYFTPDEIFEEMNLKKRKEVMFVRYDIYFDIVQCYLYIDKQDTEVDIADAKKRKIRLKDLVDKYNPE